MVDTVSGHQQLDSLPGQFVVPQLVLAPVIWLFGCSFEAQALEQGKTTTIFFSDLGGNIREPGRRRLSIAIVPELPKDGNFVTKHIHDKAQQGRSSGTLALMSLLRDHEFQFSND